MIVYSVAFVHVCLLVFFLYLNVLPLVIFNLFSVVMYLYLTVLLRRKKYTKAFFLTYAEIFLHTVVAILLVGWELGFPLYNLGIVPVSFYVTYTTPGFRKPIKYPLILMVINMLITIACRFYDYFVGPVYQLDLHGELLLFHAFNTIIAYLLVGVFSLLFLVELRSNEVALMRKNRELDHLANYDVLTALLNRRSMEERVHQAMLRKEEMGQDFCVALGDIDDFKIINDTFGHDCGDQVLRHISRILMDEMEKEDCVCRWGGEELLILMSGELETAYKKVESLRKRVESTPILFDSQIIMFTVTFGVCQYHPGEKYHQLVRRADSKMYIGKNSGKNCVVQ